MLSTLAASRTGRCALTVFVMAFVLFGALLGGCRSAPQEGDSVALARELMIESARTSTRPVRSDAAERAVRVWRGPDAGDDG